MRYDYVKLLANTKDQYFALADSLNWCGIEIYVGMESQFTHFQVFQVDPSDTLSRLKPSFVVVHQLCPFSRRHTPLAFSAVPMAIMRTRTTGPRMGTSHCIELGPTRNTPGRSTVDRIQLPLRVVKRPLCLMTGS